MGSGGQCNENIKIPTKLFAIQTGACHAKLHIKNILEKGAKYAMGALDPNRKR